MVKIMLVKDGEFIVTNCRGCPCKRSYVDGEIYCQISGTKISEPSKILPDCRLLSEEETKLWD